MEFNNYSKSNKLAKSSSSQKNMSKLTLPVFRSQWLDIDSMRDGRIKMHEQSDLQGVNHMSGIHIE